MKYCKKCGKQIEDDIKICPYCGTNLNNKSKKKWLIPLSICLALVCIGGLGYFVVYPQAAQYMERQKNEEMSEKVVNLINAATDGVITLDSEKALDTAQKEYDALSGEQKKLVSNYKKLEKAYAELRSLQDVQEVIDALNAIDENSLSAEDTSVKNVRDTYDKLTDDEKALVTNSDKLTKCEEIVRQKQQDKAAKEAAAQAEQAKNSPAPIDELLSLGGVDKGWYEFGSASQYESHMKRVMEPYVSQLQSQYSFYPTTTMISISEQDRNNRTYFVLIHDDLNTGGYAGFIVNLNTDTATFSQSDSNVSL